MNTINQRLIASLDRVTNQLAHAHPNDEAFAEARVVIAQAKDESGAERKRIIKHLAEDWNRRAACQHWKKGTKTHQKNQIEFVIGAYSALTAVGGTDIGMIAALICVGRDINDFAKE